MATQSYNAAVDMVDRHVAQGRAGGNHGEDVVFLDDLGLDDARTIAVLHGGLEDAVHLGGPAHAPGLEAVSPRQLHEVRVADQIDAGQPVVEE